MSGAERTGDRESEPMRPDRTTARGAVTLVTTILGLTAVMAAPARAYDLEPFDWSYKPRPMGEPLRLCTQGLPDRVVTIIKQAATRWNYGGFRFTFGSSGCAGSRGDGVNQIDFGPLSEGTLAVTNAFHIGRRTVECDLRINSSSTFYIGGGDVPNNLYDLFTTALHEFGHCLGLDHSSVRRAVMYRALARGEARRQLATDDVAGRRAIYGR